MELEENWLSSSHSVVLQPAVHAIYHISQLDGHLLEEALLPLCEDCSACLNGQKLPDFEHKLMSGDFWSFLFFP